MISCLAKRGRGVHCCDAAEPIAVPQNFPKSSKFTPTRRPSNDNGRARPTWFVTNRAAAAVGADDTSVSPETPSPCPYHPPTPSTHNRHKAIDRHKRTTLSHKCEKMIGGFSCHQTIDQHPDKQPAGPFCHNAQAAVPASSAVCSCTAC